MNGIVYCILFLNFVTFLLLAQLVSHTPCKVSVTLWCLGSLVSQDRIWDFGALWSQHATWVWLLVNWTRSPLREVAGHMSCVVIPIRARITPQATEWAVLENFKTIKKTNIILTETNATITWKINGIHTNSWYLKEFRPLACLRPSRCHYYLYVTGS